MRSYFFRNFITIAGFVLLCFLVLGVSFVGIGQSSALHQRQEMIESNVLELSRLSSAYARSDALESWDYRIALSSVAQSTGNHCFLTDTAGSVILCSDAAPDCAHLGRSVGESALSALQTQGYYSGISRLEGFYAERVSVAALPVLSAQGTVVAYVFASASVSGVFHVWSAILRIFLICSLAILLLAMVLSFLLTKRRARPIHAMAQAAVRFAHGDFSTRVAAEREGDELAALADSFNLMAESLEQSERRRSDFIANVAHELKTPMTTISGFADGILDGTIPPERQSAYLQTISSETKRLNRLVRSMLELSRMQSENPETLRARSFDAVDLLARTLIIFEQKINDKQLEVDALLPEDPILVCGDGDAINQVIYNLLENAVKFAAVGSVLSVSLFKQGEKAYISVKNRGETIPAEELPRIFDRFHKTDKSRSIDRDGYGLGLYIVKTILNNHGEDISVSSRDGVTEFVFSLTLKQK